MKSNEIVEKYRPRMEEWLKYAYSEGYSNGKAEGENEVRKLRTTCHREKTCVGKDEEYAEQWNDYSPLYGWCSECGKVHSGRWGHVWEYCPWCGAKIDHTEDPFPTGLQVTKPIMNEIEAMLADINPEEIRSHDTDDALNWWCNAWKRRMESLLRKFWE